MPELEGWDDERPGDLAGDDRPRTERYDSISGKTGVVAYEIGNTFITVTFANNRSYLYTADTAGRAAVEEMKELAQAGAGLSSYIARHRPTYARRW